VNGGGKLMGPSHNPRYKALFREDELEHGVAVVRDGFCVVVISSLSPYDYEAALGASLPLGYMTPVFIAQD
jgi:hypothetical protein